MYIDYICYGIWLIWILYQVYKIYQLKRETKQILDKFHPLVDLLSDTPRFRILQESRE